MVKIQILITMAKHKKRGSKKHQTSSSNNSSGKSYQPGVDSSSKKFHANPKGYNRVNAHAKRGHLGK